MREKKPVYNGYDEHYVTGSELKALLKDEYYSTGRHHCTVTALTIPEYLNLLGIKETQTYRIFLNDCFCRVMNGETDGLICFFAHAAPDKIKFCKDPTQINLHPACPLCGSVMKYKIGRYGEFLGCSQYPKCKHTENIPIIGYVSEG